MSRLSAKLRLRATIGAHLVALVAIQLILVAGLIAYAATQDLRAARADARAHAEAMIPLVVDFTTQELEDQYTSIADLPRVAELVTMSEICGELDNGEQLEANELRWFHTDVYIFASNGRPACGNTTAVDVSQESWFKSALTSPEPVTEGPLADPVTKKRVLMYATHVPAYNAVIAYALEFDSIGRVLDHQFGYGDAPAAFVVADADRVVEIGSSGGYTGRTLEGTGFARKLPRGTFKDLDGTERIYAVGTVPDVGWHVYAGVATSDALAPAMRALRERLVFAFVLFGIVIATAAVIQRRIVRPVRSLAKATSKMSQGKLDASVQPSGPNELHDLGESFNEMVGVRRQAEAALVKAFKGEQKVAEQLREIDQMRNAFLMAISHELRTPLTSVVGYSTLLKESIEDMTAEDVRVCVNAMASQSKRLERLLVDLLDIERMARGTLQPTLKDTEVRETVRTVLHNMNVAGRVTMDVKGPAHACIDAALVERMLENLISNALKHTPADARIWVRAVRRDGELRLTVEDNGPGVPDEIKERIFEPFEQGEVPEHAPGTGVGLTLVSQFAKLHGGRAWVEDRRGGGASFRVVLPSNAPSRPKPKDVREAA